jgi:hypothetical protein
VVEPDAEFLDLVLCFAAEIGPVVAIPCLVSLRATLILQLPKASRKMMHRRLARYHRFQP